MIQELFKGEINNNKKLGVLLFLTLIEIEYSMIQLRKVGEL